MLKVERETHFPRNEGHRFSIEPYISDLRMREIIEPCERPERVSDLHIQINLIERQFVGTSRCVLSIADLDYSGRGEKFQRFGVREIKFSLDDISLFFLWLKIGGLGFDPLIGRLFLGNDASKNTCG